MRGFQDIVGEPQIAFIIRIVVGLILLAASIAKLSDYRKFIDVVRNYRLLPECLTRLVALLLPVLEFTIGTALLFGLIMPYPAFAATVFFLLFASAVAINILRGRRDIECGCFRPQQEHHLTWGIVVRNIILASISAVVGMDQHDFISRLSTIEHFPIEEKVTTVLIASAVLIVWLLWSTLLTLWRLPKPGRGCKDCF